MRKVMVLAVAMVLAMPALASAQGGGQRGPGMMQQNVATLLVGKKADLALSAEQVAKLEIVAKSLQEKNAPLVQEMRAARQNGGDRQAMMATMQKVRANADEAFEKEIRPLLSAEQVTKAEQIIAESRTARRGGGSR